MKTLKIVVKNLGIILCVLIYINRALFISATYEVDNHENGETNSIVEWIIELVTGEGNDIDEDGDTNSNNACSNIAQHDFSREFAQLELMNLFSKNVEKLVFSRNENVPLNSFLDQIDHPPEA